MSHATCCLPPVPPSLLTDTTAHTTVSPKRTPPDAALVHRAVCQSGIGRSYMPLLACNSCGKDYVHVGCVSLEDALKQVSLCTVCKVDGWLSTPGSVNSTDPCISCGGDDNEGLVLVCD
eukprot:1743660-Prymnesium_polylepis.1